MIININSHFVFVVNASRKAQIRCGPIRARDIWHLSEGERVVIRCNRMGQLVNKSARLLTSFLDTVVQKGQLCPLNYSRWNNILHSYKLEIL